LQKSLIHREDKKMRQLSKEEKEELLAKLYWDTDVKPGHLYRLLHGEVKESGHIDKINLYCRLLTTYDWHTLIKLIPANKLIEVLSDPVVNRLYPKDLRNRFLYAREVLSR